MALGDFGSLFGQGLAGLVQQQQQMPDPLAQLRCQYVADMARRQAEEAERQFRKIVLAQGGIRTPDGWRAPKKIEGHFKTTFHEQLRAEIEAWLPELT